MSALALCPAAREGAHTGAPLRRIDIPCRGRPVCLPSLSAQPPERARTQVRPYAGSTFPVGADPCVCPRRLPSGPRRHTRRCVPTPGRHSLSGQTCVSALAVCPAAREGAHTGAPLRRIDIPCRGRPVCLPSLSAQPPERARTQVRPYAGSTFPVGADPCVCPRRLPSGPRRHTRRCVPTPGRHSLSGQTCVSALAVCPAAREGAHTGAPLRRIDIPCRGRPVCLPSSFGRSARRNGTACCRGRVPRV